QRLASLRGVSRRALPTLVQVSNRPPPNRTCPFQCIRLSSESFLTRCRRSGRRGLAWGHPRRPPGSSAVVEVQKCVGVLHYAYRGRFASDAPAALPLGGGFPARAVLRRLRPRGARAREGIPRSVRR